MSAEDLAVRASVSPLTVPERAERLVRYSDLAAESFSSRMWSFFRVSSAACTVREVTKLRVHFVNFIVLNLDAEHIGKMVAVGSGLTSQLGAHLSFSLVPEENTSFLGFSPSLLSRHPHLMTAILRSCSSSRSLFCLSNSLSIFSVATICVSKRCFSSAFLNLSCSKVCCLASSCCRKSTLR